MAKMVNTGGEIDRYDGHYGLERSMATMVNIGWRDRWLRCAHKSYLLMGRNQLLQRIITKARDFQN